MDQRTLDNWRLIKKRWNEKGRLILTSTSVRLQFLLASLIPFKVAAVSLFSNA